MQVCASDRPGLAGQVGGEQIGRAVSAGNSVAIVFESAEDAQAEPTSGAVSFESPAAMNERGGFRIELLSSRAEVGCRAKKTSWVEIKAALNDGKQRRCHYERPRRASGCETVDTSSRPRAELLMTVFSFTLEIEGADLMSAAAQNALFDAGCDDATFGVSNGVQAAEFDREAAEFAEAVASAIKAVEAVVPGARAVEIRRERDGAAAG
jgi:hypothetical protein